MDFAVTAQAAPVVIDNGISFALPIVILLLGLAGALAESRWRVAQVEKRQDKLEERQTTLEQDHGETKKEVSTTTAILERLETGFTEMRGEIRNALRKVS